MIQSKPTGGCMLRQVEPRKGEKRREEKKTKGGGRLAPSCGRSAMGCRSAPDTREGGERRAAKGVQVRGGRWIPLTRGFSVKDEGSGRKEIFRLWRYRITKQHFVLVFERDSLKEKRKPADTCDKKIGLFSSRGGNWWHRHMLRFWFQDIDGKVLILKLL